MNKVKDKVSEEYCYCDLSEEKESEKRVPFIVRALLFTATGMGFGCFDGFGGISPFAVSFLSALPFPYCLPSFIGSVIGYLLTVRGGDAVKYIGASLIMCLFRLIMNRRFSEREGSFISSVVVFSSLFLSGLVRLWFDEVALLPLLIIIAESLLGLFSSVLFLRAFNLSFYKGSIESFTKKEILSLAVSLGITLMCLSSVNLQGLSPGRISAMVLMMFICLYKGMGTACAVGALAGIFLSLTPGGEYLFPAFVTACLVGGFLSETGQTLLSLSFTGTFFTVSFFCCDIAEDWLSLIEPVIACGVFLLIPASKISELQDCFDKLLSVHKKADDFALAEKLKNASVNMEAVAVMVDDVSGKLDRIINPEVNRLFSRLQQKVCDKCEKKQLCWNKNFDSTASDVLCIMGVEKTGEGRIGLSVRCPEYDLLCNELSSVYPAYSNAIATKNRITEMRRILTDQFSGMSDFLYELAGNITSSRTKDKGKSACLKTALRDSGIPVERLDCFCFEGRVTVEITLYSDESKYVKKIGPLIEFITGRRFGEPETEATGSSLFLLFREKATYSVKSGYSQRSMKAGNLCGDTVGIFTTDTGEYNFLLSDGMGTGSRAAIDSNLTASVIEKLVCSCFSFEGACRTVNNTLIMKSTDESIATVDAVKINPYNCRAVFYKAGGALSLIRRGDSITVIEKASLPLGIIRNVSLVREERELKKGDIVLMLSDGVTNSDCGWINDELLAWSKSDMQSLASHIASLAALRSESATRDDITVIAFRIESER
ncbi:MAG: SpoIIE family protein phosphatase [Clostridia bacterium]|nr:SpoIIE family protein phosphatase [Clostridia bacterium]